MSARQRRNIYESLTKKGGEATQKHEKHTGGVGVEPPRKKSEENIYFFQFCLLFVPPAVFRGRGRSRPNSRPRFSAGAAGYGRSRSRVVLGWLRTVKDAGGFVLCFGGGGRRTTPPKHNTKPQGGVLPARATPKQHDCDMRWTLDGLRLPNVPPRHLSAVDVGSSQHRTRTTTMSKKCPL